VDAPKPWGWEKWLTSTRSEGPAALARGGGTLRDLVVAHPEVLGTWARRLFGDEMPIFAKLIHTSFPPRVHVGFRRAVGRDELLGWLHDEQESMRALFGALRVDDARAFEAYQARYSAWATEQSLAGWGRDDDDARAALLRDFVAPAFDVAAWLRGARRTRSAIAEALREVDLRSETGNLLLSSAGIVHAIFGLSLQTHPLDRSRGPLQALFATLAERSAAGATDRALAETIDRAGLAALRALNSAPPKNEAWMPTTLEGADVLLEPQQTSDTTYSLADFYTPITWTGSSPRFRKGDPARGVGHAELARFVDDLELGATSLDSIRRAPVPVRDVGPPGRRSRLSRIVDEPASWPFFTAYQLEIEGTVQVRPPPGVFQQLVVTRGRTGLADGRGDLGELSPLAPGFVPATLQGTYILTAREPSTVLLFAVPSARGGAPEVAAPAAQ
jgi:hypothetical protein